MTPLSPRVRATIDRLFPHVERALVVDCLTTQCSTNLPLMRDPALLDRIQLAVLKLSAGQATTLTGHIRIAQVDWRDTLVAAGFGNDVNAHIAWADRL
jgi:hypothetical protein